VKQKINSSSRLHLFLISFLFLALFLITPLSALIGDSFLEKNKIDAANFLYKIGAASNFFSYDFEKRFLAISLNKEETNPTEETSDLPLARANQESKVLGVNVNVPVLMFHYIRVNLDHNDKVGFNLSVTPNNFAQQMNYLATHSYHPITLDEMGSALFSNGKLPPKPIVITFDDGYRDSYTSAFPILKKYGFKAVNFVITGLVGAPNYLTWEQIKEMNSSGIFSFGSHTAKHRALTELKDELVRKELADSKNILEQELGVIINWFAYPYGKVNDRVSYLTQASGYLGAFGTNLGTYQSTDYLFTLPRIRVGGGDTVKSFAAKLPWN